MERSLKPDFAGREAHILHFIIFYSISLTFWMGIDDYRQFFNSILLSGETLILEFTQGLVGELVDLSRRKVLILQLLIKIFLAVEKLLSCSLNVVREEKSLKLNFASWKALVV